jgi:glycosyltransferase involved in cell wall biosynthesis
MSSNNSHTIDVVIPVFNGKESIEGVIFNLQPFLHVSLSPGGVKFIVKEIILVFDCGFDGSEDVLRELQQKHSYIRVVWLTRNFGQHAATLAGMASSTSDWIITIDEDGQQDPSDIPKMLDVALENNAQLVYARPTNKPPHGWLRNAASKITKGTVARFLTGGDVRDFNSFRLIIGEVGRTISAYVGHGVYLDVALEWIVRKVATCDVELNPGTSRPSGYNRRNLLSHFWRLVLSSGTRLLRLASIAGVVSFFGGVALIIAVIFGKIFFDYPVTGWASVFVALLLFGGSILLVMGIVAEYIGLLVRTSIGKPLYVIGSDPQQSALRQ